MKKILIRVALAGMLIPVPASAALNYDAIDVGYSTTNYTYQSLAKLEVGMSKSYSGNVYLGASYAAGSQPGDTVMSERKVNSISFSAGYHTPLRDDMDAIAEGHITLGSVKFAGTSASANGYDIGAGVRRLFVRGLEGTLAVIYASTSNGTSTQNNTFLKTQFGFNFTQEFQMTAGIDFSPYMTTTLGLRLFY